MGITSSSEEISRQFYGRLGAVRLASRTQPDWDRTILQRLTKMVDPDQDVLDLGCGYGRISVALCDQGYRVVGLDLSEQLVRHAARGASTLQGLSLVVGSMLRMPFRARSFDVVICLWSTFNELLTHAEQQQAVREVVRVLRPSGRAFFEGPTYEPPTREQLRSGERYGPEGRISADVIEGLPNPHFRHDSKSLEALARASDASDYDVYEDDWAGRPRLFLKLVV